MRNRWSLAELHNHDWRSEPGHLSALPARPVTVHRITRSALHRTDNNAQVRGYGRALRSIFDDWVRHSQAAGMSTQGLSGRLQQAAEANYEPAYLRGKRQAFPAAQLGPDDRQWISQALRQNRTYVERSLVGDIQDKATLQRMRGSDFGELGKTFGSRVEQQYGGQLWRVTEAGFRAGVRDIGDTLRQRFHLPLRQEDDDESDDQQDDGALDEAAILEALSILLKLSRSRVARALTRVGVAVADLATATSTAAQQVARDLGVAPDALSSAATEAVTAAVGGGASAASLDASLADALGISASDLRDLGASLAGSAGYGFRMGCQYETQNDGEVCMPCREEGSGGQEDDGIYWEPLEAPLPGEACRGRGNCRCSLAVVYDTGSGDAIAA